MSALTGEAHAQAESVSLTQQLQELDFQLRAELFGVEIPDDMARRAVTVINNRRSNTREEREH